MSKSTDHDKTKRGWLRDELRKLSTWVAAVALLFTVLFGFLSKCQTDAQIGMIQKNMQMAYAPMIKLVGISFKDTVSFTSVPSASDSPDSVRLNAAGFCLVDLRVTNTGNTQANIVGGCVAWLRSNGYDLADLQDSAIRGKGHAEGLFVDFPGPGGGLSILRGDTVTLEFKIAIPHFEVRPGVVLHCLLNYENPLQQLYGMYLWLGEYSVSRGGVGHIIYRGDTLVTSGHFLTPGDQKPYYFPYSSQKAKLLRSWMGRQKL